MQIKIDWHRIGMSMFYLGLIGLVCYLLLTVLSFFVLAEESWGIFNMWSIGRFVVIISITSGLLLGGWLLSRKTCPISDS